MTSAEVPARPVQVSRLPIYINYKNMSRIPVLLPKSKPIHESVSSATVSLATISTTTTTTTTSTISISCSTTPAYTTTTTTTISKKPTKSVTVTLLPLPATRKPSVNGSSNKKLFGILKRPSFSIEPKNSSLQNLAGSKQDIITSKQNAISTIPDLIRNIPSQKHNESSKESGSDQIMSSTNSILPEKISDNLESVTVRWEQDRSSKQDQRKFQNDGKTCHIGHVFPTNFNKMDSFSDDTASSVTSYSSACGDLNNTLISDDTRWSSTSGYESDDTGSGIRQTNIRKPSSSSALIKGVRAKKTQTITTPWLNFKEINFQNAEILTEDEISTLNARLERLFEVYKKIERNRIIKAANKIKYTNNKNDNGTKFNHAMPDVKSNLPRWDNRRPTVPDKVNDTKQHFISKQKIYKTNQVKDSKSTNNSKKNFTNHLRSLKSCFSGSSGTKFSPQKQISKLQHKHTSLPVIHQQLNGTTKQNVNIYSNNSYGGTPVTGEQSKKRESRTLRSSAVEDVNYISAKSVENLKNYDFKRFPSSTNIEENLRQVCAGIEKLIQTCKKQVNTKISPQPESPISLPASSINKMTTFKCPRVKNKSISSSERKFNRSTSGSLTKVEENYGDSKAEELEKKRGEKNTNVRRSTQALLTMKLPKRLSKAEIEQVKRASSRSLTGHGLLGGSMLEKPKIVLCKSDGLRPFAKNVSHDSVEVASSTQQLNASDLNQKLSQRIYKTQQLHAPSSANSSIPSLQSFKCFPPKRVSSKNLIETKKTFQNRNITSISNSIIARESKERAPSSQSMFKSRKLEGKVGLVTSV